MIEIIQAIIFGIIQGITEYLPISSTAHLILFENFVGFDTQFFDMFKVVIQFGSILAVVILFWHKLWPWSSRKSKTEQVMTLNLWGKIIVGVIPAGVIGVLFNDVVDSVLSYNWVIAIALIFYGIIFILIENQHRHPKVGDLNEITYGQAFAIGCFQVLALIPGTSRSGSTIIGASLIGFSRTLASEFSFFLAVPVMAGASLVKVIKFGFNYTGNEIILLIIATVVSFVVSVLAIRFLLSYIRKHDFKVFGYYRIVLGIIIFILLLLNLMPLHY